MANNYEQPGEVIDHAPASAVASGEPVAIGERVGVALGALAANEEGAFAVVGVYVLPKLGVALSQGDDVYLTPGGSITGTATDNTRAGYAWSNAASGDATVAVKLDG